MATDPQGPRLPRPRIGIDSRVTIGGRPGTIVTYRPTARGMRYGVALDSGAHLPDVGEDVLDPPSI